MSSAVLGQRQTLGVEAQRRVGLATGRQQRRDVLEADVTVGKPAVADVEPEV